MSKAQAEDEDVGGGADDSQMNEEVIARAKEVAGHILKKNGLLALQTALANPPVLAKSEKIKDSNCETVQKALAIIPDAELSNIISQLDNERCETLMKYTYKILTKSVDCATALKLQSILHEKIGPGSILRVLTDRKTV